ncbi:hypothetical protein Nepgr_009453 [Nepenthes gracilis]|uniref:Transcription factor GAMYB-like n=1 Tax=Nepenthes gracilis TaxID=150966 RepID=A0AAD3SAK4_NEPGR|nr:hypothetical protein Nepgr_009453 [Nepenthes gracilis]
MKRKWRLLLNFRNWRFHDSTWLILSFTVQTKKFVDCFGPLNFITGLWKASLADHNFRQLTKMIDTATEAENTKTFRCRKNSPSVEEAGSGGNSSGGSALKKGPWTSAEDAILVDYVSKHGEGNWNAVQKHSGLSRCGKSCRLRWANHLRPDLKKGAFTPEEESCIIQLHAKMGNKWACMAAELPGRTDNEIKNYWNTRIKRLQRAGLPIYPPETSVQAMKECQKSQDMGSCREGEKNRHDASQKNCFDIPHEFKTLELNQGLLSCPHALLDLPASSILQKGVNSSHSFGFMFQAMHPQKRLRDLETPFCNCVGITTDSFPSFDPYEDDTYGKLGRTFWLSSPYDADLNVNNPSIVDVLLGSHALINGNSSSSEPIVAMKSELPSLQYSASHGGSWPIPPSPLPSLESFDTSIQTPLRDQKQSDCPSPRSSGLLEAIVYESQSLKILKNKSCPQISETSPMAGYTVESLPQSIAKWEACGDPISPFSQSAASVFGETLISRSSSDEPLSAEAMPGYKIKPEAVDWISLESDEKKDISSLQLECMRPDVLLDSFWFGQCIWHNKDQFITAMDMGQLLGDDTNRCN